MFNHNDIAKDSVKLKGFSKYTSVENAWQIFSKGADIRTLYSTHVTLYKARGRVLSEEVKAEINLPPFDRAAVDGYAVRSQDTRGASLTNPIVLDLMGAVEIGQRGSGNVREMEAVRISTGAPTPTGSDSVVMLEYTEEIDKTHVEVKRSTTPNQNLIRTGEDIRAGEIFLRKGTLIKPQDIALLAALGKNRVKVFRKPRVAVLSTGDELVEVGRRLHGGKCFDSNRYFILTSVEEFGGEPLDLGITPDNLKMLKSRLVKAAKIADLIIVSGATSVGCKDLVPDAVKSIERSSILIHGVAIRPGRPVALGKVAGKPIILLPGFPVAAMVNFYLFAQKAICKMLGVSYSPFGGWKITAKIGRRVASEAGIRDFVRVHVKHSQEGYIAEPIRVRGSAVISSMVKANGILVIPEDREGFEEGEHAEVIIMRNLGAETYDA